MTATMSDMTREFLDALFASVPPDPDQKRYLCLTRGADPYFNTEGKYSHHEWKEKRFEWPDQADDAAAWIQQWAATCDVYMCPYLMKSAERTKGNAAWRQIVHSDADGDADDIKKKISDLGGGIIIWSGSPGHGHVYLLLGHVVTKDQHEMLCEGLRDHLGSDAKIRDNDVLRPAWSFNHKPTLHGRPSQIVRPDNGYNVASLDPIELGRKLKKDITNVAAPSQSSTDCKQVDLTRYPRVVEELIDKSDPPDRSKDTYRIVCACRDCGLELNETRWVINLRTDLAGRVGARHDDDVLRAWDRAQNEWQAQMARPGQPGPAPAAPPGPGRFFGRQGLRALDLADEVMRSVVCGYGAKDKRFYTYGDGVWTAGSEPIKEELTKLLANRYRITYAGAVFDLIQFSPSTARISDSPLAELINVPNGMIKWETGDLLTHSPHYLSTVQLPVEYMPSAKCPLFEKFLREVLPADLIDSGFIWELIGYTLYSGNPLHIAVLLFGKGRNGKGTLIRVLKALLGEHNISTVSLHELTENKFRVATLYQKLANLAGDLDSKWLENTALFKKITGHDGIQGEYKYGASFEFDPWALPFYSANKAFGSPDSSEGWVARWIVVPFPNSFLGREDRSLESKLTSELELRGILAKSVAALPALMARGNFADLPSLAKAKAAFVLASDAVRAWIDEYCLLDAAAWTPRTDLYKAYRWSTGGDGGKQLGAREFYNRVEQVGGIVVTQRQGARGFAGVQVRASWGSGVSAGQAP